MADHDEPADVAPPTADALAAVTVPPAADTPAATIDGEATPVSVPQAPRGLLSDDMQYAVYLHPGALETLGESIAPYLTHGPHGAHIVCSDIDTGGALCEMQVETTKADGTRQTTEVMFPVAMIRLVLSLGGLADGFGFRSRE